MSIAFSYSMKGHSKTTNCSLYAPFEKRPEYIHSLPTQNPVKDHKLYGNEKYEKSASFKAKRCRRSRRFQNQKIEVLAS